MKKLILILSLVVGSLAFGQEDVPYKMLGVWQNLDNEFVKIYTNIDGNTFFQRVKGKTVIASGQIIRSGNEIHIVRSDKKDEYNLVFIIGDTNMVITKPRSDQAWLWNKVN